MATRTISRQQQLKTMDKKLNRSVSVEPKPRAGEKVERKPPTISESQSLEIKPVHDMFGESYSNIFQFILNCIEEPFGKVIPVDMDIFSYELKKVDYDVLLKLQVCLYRKIIYYDEPEKHNDITVDICRVILRDQIELVERQIKPEDTFDWFCCMLEDMLNAGCAVDVNQARMLLINDLFNLEIVRVDPRLYYEPIIFTSTIDYTPEI